MKTLILTLTLLPYLLFAQTRIIPFSSNPAGGAAPDAPTSFVGVDHTNLRITGSWTDGANTDTIYVYADSSATKAGLTSPPTLLIARIPAGTQALDIGGMLNTQYYLVGIKGMNDYGLSDMVIDTFTVDSTQLITPSASSDFTTDGTGYWSGENGATIGWDADSLYMTCTWNTGNMGVYKASIVVSGFHYYMSFRAKTSQAAWSAMFRDESHQTWADISNPTLTTAFQNYSAVGLSASPHLFQDANNAGGAGYIIYYDDIIVQRTPVEEY